MIMPNEIQTLLQKKFDYPAVLFAQVATLSSNGPDLRTMGMFDIDNEGSPILLTNTASHKWKQLLKNRAIALLLFNRERDVQIIARGKATLLTLESDRKLLEHYWELTPLQAKATYNHDDPEGEYKPLKSTPISLNPPDTFGVIRVTPTQWETLAMDAESYHSSERFLFKKEGEGWHKKQLNAI